MKCRYSKFLLVLTIFLLIVSIPVSATNIGYVNYDLLFNAHPEYNSKNEEFIAMVEQYSEEFQQVSEEVTDQIQLNEIVAIYDGKIAESANELRRYILESLTKHIVKVAETNNIDVVLIDSTVLYGGVDLTRLVIEEMYRSYGISVPSHLRNY